MSKKPSTMHPHNSVPDWYRLQQRIFNYSNISPDQAVTDRIVRQGWNLDLKLAHSNLQKCLQPHHVNKDKVDFFVLTELELGKWPLPTLFRLINHKIDSVQVGGYVSILSYYINNTQSHDCLTDSFKDNIELVFKRNLKNIRQIENVSVVQDYPINVVKDDALVEGSNFIFVHPNVRFWIWK